MLFQKKFNPKKLSIREIWRLYKELKNGLIGRNPNDTLLDEIISILERVDKDAFKQSIKIMYGDVKNKSSVESAIMFSRGLKESNFFDFCKFVETINAKPSR